MMKVNNISLGIFFTALFVVIFLMNVWTPETLQDDIIYKFVRLSGDRVDASLMINNLKEVFVSQYNHYLWHSGRLMPHLLLQIFDGLIGKSLFNVFNAAVFCLLIYYVNKLAGNVVDLLGCSLSFALVFLLSPLFKETSLWFTGSFNYLWAIVAGLFYFAVFLNLEEKKVSLKYWLLGIGAIFLGWTNEGIVIPISVSLGIYFLLHFKRVIHSAAFPWILGFGFGTALTVFSPATLNNAHETVAGGGLTGRIFTVAVTLSQLRIFWIWVAGVIISSFANLQKTKRYFHKYTLICNATVCSLLVFFLADCHYPRVRYGMEVFSLIALLALIREYKFRRASYAVVALSIIASFGFSIPVLSECYKNYQINQQILTQLKTPGKTLILLPQDNIPDCYNNYVLRHATFCKRDVWYFAADKQMLEGALYGKKYVQYLPEELYDDITRHPEKYRVPATTDSCGLYAYETSKAENFNIQYILRPIQSSEVPFYFRPFYHHIERYFSLVDTPRNQTFVSIHGKCYLVMTAPILKEKRSRVEKVHISRR